jgi:hypothetical protein
MQEAPPLAAMPARRARPPPHGLKMRKTSLVNKTSAAFMTSPWKSLMRVLTGGSRRKSVAPSRMELSSVRTVVPVVKIDEQLQP